MAEALPPWPHRAVEVTETRAHISREVKIHATNKSRDHPSSVRLHGKLTLVCHGSRRAVVELDHRVEVADVATFTSVEACSELIHDMLAEAPATSEYDLAADNWVNTIYGPLGIAMGIARYVREWFDDEEDDDGVLVPGFDFDIHLPDLLVALVYSELCAICLLDSRTEDKDTHMLPCSHLFHKSCITTWFQRASTCPTCRRECFVRSASSHEDELSDSEEEPMEDELYED
ncbi:hypothetical protein QYE76_057749 [Lolium multiflorum]|uniref:RING-type domain-containing protein n=1 Tax=Lolium multiflorum TaxID=4521 RepID=A0AAD8T514_LOLMU|nr:hypothetical protein QYE76_057749 [Lolium multiflorum]